MSDLSYVMFLLLRRSPLVLVLLAGLIMMFVRWKRHPRASLLGAIGTGLYIVDIFVLAFIYYMLPSIMHRFMPMSDSAFTVIQIVDDFIYAAILILLVTAAFSDRKPKTTITF